MFGSADTPPRHSGAAPATGSWWGDGAPTARGGPCHGTLSSADIDGARPRTLCKPARTTPHPAVEPGMQPTRTTRHRNSPQPDTLCVADILGTRSGHSDWLRPRAQPLSPLEPAYQWLPIVEDHPPAPKFVRDTLDVSDIVGPKADHAALRTARSHNKGLPSTMAADDIEGTRPGWKAHKLFAEPRDSPLSVSDICAALPTPKEKQAQQVQRQLSNASSAGTAGGALGDGSTACETSAPFGRTHRLPQQERGPPAGLSPAARSREAGQGGYSTTSGAAGHGYNTTSGGMQQAGQQLPDCGMAFTADWHKQRLGAKMAEAGVARQARAAADEAIATAAAAVAARAPAGVLCDGGSGSSSGGLAGVLRNLKTCDRDHTGRVQGSELAAALQRSGLQLSQGEVSHLVTSVRDSHGSVEWRPFVSKMWSQLQHHAETAPLATGGAGAGAGGAHHTGQGSMPQFVAVRQRRLQTHVAMALNQQPEALAAEAADVGSWATSLPWRLPNTKPFSKRVFERQEEFPEVLSFCQGDEQAAAQASLQWRASKNPQHAWAMRRENRPSKQTRAHGAGTGATSLPPTPAHNMGGESQSQVQWQAQAGGITAPTNFTIIHRKAGSPLLAAERAARVAGSAEVALVRSLE